MRRRWKPYTAIGIRRVPCARCGAPSNHQWNVCADFNSFRAICWPCDIEMNRMVLNFMRFPNVDQMVADYKERMEKDGKGG